MKQGFSLVELSIVLVIVGLLAGGIITGRSMIRASELNSVGTEWKKFDVAFTTFNDRYFGPPGDITNATTIWGAEAVCPGDYTTPSTDKKTCDGNGSGRIDTLERYRAWQHMANDGLIEGRYSGVPSTASGASIQGGLNVPKGSLNASMHQIYNTLDTTSSSYFPQAAQHTVIVMHVRSPTISGMIGVMSPEEAWNLDTKLDDGKPGYGTVVHPTSSQSTVGACVTSSTASTAEYALSNTAVVCTPNYMLGL